MKIWITASVELWSEDVEIFAVKPEWHEVDLRYYQPNTGERGVHFCRRDTKLLLKGTGKRLPRHRSKSILEVDLKVTSVKCVPLKRRER